MREYARQKVHISWHISALSVGILCGIAAMLIVPRGFFSGTTWLVSGLSLLAIVVIKRTRIFLLVALLAGFSVGIWRGSLEREALLHYAPYYGLVVRLSGVVNEDASVSKGKEQELQLRDIRIAGQTFHGRVWVSISSQADIKRSDTVSLEGVLGEGFGNTAASMYRAKLMRVERPYPGDIARRVRDWFANGVRSGVSEPQSSLGIGYLTGQRSSLPPAFDEQLRIVGLTHAVVASGYNLTILVGFARGVFSRVSRYLATLFAGLMIAGFVLVTGFSPSMSRAGLVAGLSLAAWYWGRTIHPLILLPFAACITSLINPSYVWGDIGWCLSFTAFAGVIVIAPLMRRYFWGEQKKTGAIKQILTDTISAQLATMPIILFVFSQLSTYALLANLMVLPFVPLAMLLTFLSGIVGLISPEIAHWAGLPAQWLLNYMTWAVERIASWPGAQGEMGFTVSMLVVAYAGLILLCVFWVKKTAYRFRE